VTVGNDLLAGQVAYYRRRASEYDVTAYGDLVRQRHFVIFEVTGPIARPPRDHAGLCGRPMMLRWPLATA